RREGARGRRWHHLRRRHLRGRSGRRAPSFVWPLSLLSPRRDRAAAGGGPVSARVLIAGIGNIFFGDDGFATEVTGRLARSPAPPGLAIADFGTGTLHLAYALLEGPELAVIIDALPRG